MSSTIEAMEEAEKYLVAQWEFDGKICQEGLNLITKLRAAIERERERERDYSDAREKQAERFRVFERMRTHASRLVDALHDASDSELVECENDYDSDCNCPICRGIDAKRSLEQALAAAERVEKGGE